MYFAEVYGKEGKLCSLPLRYAETAEGFTLTLSRSEIPDNAVYAEFAPELFASDPVEGGYYVLAGQSNRWSSLLCELHPREDTEYISDYNIIPVMGACLKEGCYLAVITGMAWDTKTVCSVKEGKYRIYQRFALSAGMVYEDPQLTVIRLPEGSTYSDMARVYRARKLSEGVLPLTEKVKTRPEIKEAVMGPEVRIRHAWKPVPSPVADQTPETEPPLHIAMDFEKTEHLLRRMKANGVEHAHICLVGWNIGGHDGRWMQHFPVEEKLGGEEKLKKLIETAHELGYQIVGHSNVKDSYSIAEMWDRNDMAVDQEGNVIYDSCSWGGGRPYQTCPTRFMKTVERDYPRMAELGFRGMHYVDVMSILPPHRCWSKEHPVHMRQAIEECRKVMRRSKELFGGFASEGCMDYAVEDLDYGLYSGMNLLGEVPAVCDRPIPFVQLVYHGIMLYNPSSETVNHTIKSRASQLKFHEYGGRPAGYIHSRFLSSGNHWMGVDDLTCETEEKLEESAKILGEMYREYAAMRHLQYAFMEKHEMVADNVFETTYSDGTVIRTDYNTETWEMIPKAKEEA